MATLITDRDLENEIQAQRRAWGADRYDEIWEGVYVVATMPDIEHQVLVTAFTTVFQTAVGFSGEATVLPGVNISDRKRGWKKNYRIPDVAVFLADTTAENHGAYWLGGPDFGIEVVSPDDKTREKLPFYETVRTRELLIIERDPWATELYRLDKNTLVLAGSATLEEPAVLQSAVLPLTFELLSGEHRPQVRIKHPKTDQQWLV